MLIHKLACTIGCRMDGNSLSKAWRHGAMSIYSRNGSWVVGAAMRADSPIDCAPANVKSAMKSFLARHSAASQV